MRAHGRVTILSLAAGVIALSAPARAEADKKIAVLDIEGARTPHMRQALASLIKPDNSVLGDTVYRDAARRLRATKLTPQDVMRVCGFLEVDGVLEGTLVAEAGRYKLVLRLRAGRTGAITKKLNITLDAPRLSDKIERKLRPRLMLAVEDLPGMGGSGKVKHRASDENDEGVADSPPPAGADSAGDDGGASDGGDDAAPKKSKRAKKGKKIARHADADEGDAVADDGGADDARDEPVKASKKTRKHRAMHADASDADTDDAGVGVGDDAGDDGANDDVADDDGGSRKHKRRVAAKDDAGDDAGDEPEVKIDRGARRHGYDPATSPFTISAGVSFSARSLKFAADPASGNVPPGYKGAIVPGVYAAGELYPLAGGGPDSPMSGLGLGFMVDRVIKLQSTIDNGMGGTTALATTQTRYGVDVRYRKNFGKVTAVLSAGYARLDFQIDKAAAPMNVIVDIPNVSYHYVPVGLGLRIAVAPKVALVASGRFMAVLTTGEVQKSSQYGAAKITGVDADAGLEFQATDRIVVNASGHFQRVGFAFKGAGALDDRNLDGNPDVGGASDLFYGGFVTAGYLF